VNITKIIFAGLMTVSLCSAALVQMEVRLLQGQGLVVSSNQTKTVMANCPNQCDLPSHCDTVKRAGVDMVFLSTGFWDDFECGCGGNMLQLLSGDTIRELKKTSSINFGKPLAISDTAYFSSVRQSSCSLWTANCPDTQNSCYPCHPLQTFPVIWNLGRTHDGNYYLFRSVARHTDATINYILQTDGSLDFKGATVAVLNPAKKYDRLQNASGPGIVKRFGTPMADQRFEKIYDVRGRLIKAASGAVKFSNRAPIVYIVKKTNGRDRKYRVVQ
jgi:hypothetical protein